MVLQGILDARVPRRHSSAVQGTTAPARGRARERAAAGAHAARRDRRAHRYRRTRVVEQDPYLPLQPPQRGCWLQPFPAGVLGLRVAAGVVPLVSWRLTARGFARARPLGVAAGHPGTATNAEERPPAA